MQCRICRLIVNYKHNRYKESGMWHVQHAGYAQVYLRTCHRCYARQVAQTSRIINYWHTIIYLSCGCSVKVCIAAHLCTCLSAYVAKQLLWVYIKYEINICLQLIMYIQYSLHNAYNRLNTLEVCTNWATKLNRYCNQLPDM